jgi:HK97 family phage major capsid protein
MAVSIQNLRDQRKAKAKEARNLVDKHSGAQWTDEVNGQYEALMNEIERLDAETERHQRVMEIEAQNLKTAQRRADREGTSVDEAAHRNEQELQMFDSWLRGGERALSPDQLMLVQDRVARFRAAGLGTQVPSEGAYLTPDLFGGRLLEAMAAFGGMRSVAQVISTGSGNTMSFPITDPTSEEGEIVGENAAVSDEESIAFGAVTIGAHMYSSKAVAVPFQLLQDSAIDLESHIVSRLAMRLARITNKHFTTGTGTNQPKGVVVCSALGATGATGQTATVIYDDLVDLEHSVDPAYRESGRCRFMFHDQTLKVLKKLKDGENRPLWLPGVAVKEPDTILSYPYTINQHMAQMAAGAKSMLFGDFSYYVIRDVMQFLLFRMTDSAYTKKAQVGFLAFMRSDGNLIAADSGAIKHYKNAAS